MSSWLYRETFWTKEERELHKGRRKPWGGGGGGKLMLSNQHSDWRSHGDVGELNLLFSNLKSEAGLRGLSACFLSRQRLLLRHKGPCFWARVLWLLGWLSRNSLVILDRTVLTWRAEGEEEKLWDSFLLFREEKAVCISGLMVRVVPSFAHSGNILPGYVCVSQGASVCRWMPPGRIFMFDKEREGGEPPCDMHAIITSSFAFKAPNVELHRRFLAMQIHTVLQRG